GRARTQLDVAKGTPAAVTVKLLGDDAMEADNGRTVLVEGAVRTSCLVISGDADRGAGQSASRFLMKALAAASSEGAPMDARLADPDGVSSAELSAADVVILSDVSRPSSAFSAALRRYVMEGGGLWVAAGPHFDPAAYRARLGDLLPARLGTAARDASGLGLGDAGSLAAIANGLRGAEVRGRILFDDWGADDLVLLSFTDGSPALVERTAGKGRVALLATSLDDSWSAFPFRVGFVPFVAQMVMRLAEGGGAGRREIAPGFPHVLAKPDGTVRLEVRGPDGARIAVTEQGVVTDTTRPGLYTVHVETSRAALAPRPALAFTVAPDPAESGFERTTASMPTGTAASAARDSRAKLPLAPWWFLAAALLVAVEGVLRLGRRRFRASAEVSSPSA
ncbi:MAG: hypothetical protein KC417_04775, partial [Myxococcales bacterium]|nr:hypothetical protein [Myxococcales bacterium]